MKNTSAILASLVAAFLAVGANAADQMDKEIKIENAKKEEENAKKEVEIKKIEVEKAKKEVEVKKEEVKKAEEKK